MLTDDLVIQNIILNSLFAGILGVILTEALFLVFWRIMGYDYVFGWETGRIFLRMDVEDYSDREAGIAGFVVHVIVGLGITLLFTTVFSVLMAALLKVGPLIYQTTEGTAFFENTLWFVLFNLIILVIIEIRVGEKSLFSVFLLPTYVITFAVITGLLYGSYLFGVPGFVF